MICEVCNFEHEDAAPLVLPPGSSMACPRCHWMLNYALNFCRREVLTPELMGMVTTQTLSIVMDLVSFENLRRMTRQELRALLRDRLQEFGDKCMAVWDEKCGGD